jgi:hypothetical protein
MGCKTSIESQSVVVLDKDTILTIQDSWKKFTDANTLAEHGINMVIR